MFTVPLFPRKAHRRANKNSCEAKGHYTSQDKEDDAPHYTTEALLGEYLQKEEEEGDFNEAEDSKVDDLGDPKVLMVEVLARVREDIGIEER